MPQSKVMLVLGCGMTDRGTLARDGQRSVHIARNLLEHEADGLLRIVFSGGSSPRLAHIGAREAALMASAMTELPAERRVPFVIEDRSSSTITNILMSRPHLMDVTSGGTLLVVRGPNHSKRRLIYCLKKVLGPRVSIRIVGRRRLTPRTFWHETISLLSISILLGGTKDGDADEVRRRVAERTHRLNARADGQRPSHLGSCDCHANQLGDGTQGRRRSPGN